MNWKYVKKLADEKSIERFEKQYNFKFSSDYIACVKENNGGRPSLSVFDTSKTKERTIKTLLSFNEEDRETLWKANKDLITIDEKKYIAIAVDNFGNYICFDGKDKIVFIDHESGDVEKVANSFSGFLDMLK